MPATVEHAIKQLFVQSNDDQAAAAAAATPFDCALIVGDKETRIGCHRAILYARSPVFVQQHLHDNNGTDGNNNNILEINLPEDDAETIGAIVTFCYTNSISAANISTHLRTSTLLLASTKFGLDALSEFSLQVTRALDVQKFPASLEGKTIMVPNSKLDLSVLINEETISDLLMRTNNGDIHVHRCILLAQVPSLSSQIKNDMIDLSNMSHSSVQRAVEYIYTGKITANLAQEQTLEDIVTAKQIGANAMLSKLQTMVKVTDDNSLDVLKVALVNDLSLLKSMALKNLDDKDYDELFGRIKLLEDSCSTIVSEFSAVVKDVESKRSQKPPQLIQGISFRGCLGLVATSAASLFLLRLEMDDFLVASANVCFLVVTIYFFL